MGAPLRKIGAAPLRATEADVALFAQMGQIQARSCANAFDRCREAHGLPAGLPHANGVMVATANGKAWGVGVCMESAFAAAERACRDASVRLFRLDWATREEAEYLATQALPCAWNEHGVDY